MEQDSDSFDFQPTSGKKALNETLCKRCGAINTEGVRADILHLMTSEVLTATSSMTAQSMQELEAQGAAHKGPQCPNTHTGMHTTKLASVSAQINLQVEAHTSQITKLSYRFQLLLGFILHPPDVLHSQLNPLVNPTEQLAMEVGKYPFFLL